MTSLQDSSAPTRALDPEQDSLTSTSAPTVEATLRSCAEANEWHVLSLPEFSDDYLDETSTAPDEMRFVQLKTVPSEVKSRSRDVNKSSRNRVGTSTARPLASGSEGTVVEGSPHNSNGRTPAKQASASATKEGEKTDSPQLKQEVVQNPEIYGNLLQRELARLNLNVLRTMTRMLGEQEQKFAAERNTLRASGRMMRAEMRRALSETVKINSERRKLDLERDVLQSQLLARRRSARLLDRMMRDLEHGRDINRLYTYSRVLGSAPTHRDLGEQLDYETDMLDQQRFYLQPLMVPRWQQPPDDGPLYPVELTRMHRRRIPTSESESSRSRDTWRVTPEYGSLAGERFKSVGDPSQQAEPEEQYDERLAADDMRTEQVSQRRL